MSKEKKGLKHIDDPLPTEIEVILNSLSQAINPSDDPDGVKVFAVILGSTASGEARLSIRLNPTAIFPGMEDIPYKMIANSAFQHLEAIRKMSGIDNAN